MRCSGIQKHKKLQKNLMQGIVNYFQIKFFEDACVLPIIGHRNREFMNNAG